MPSRRVEAGKERAVTENEWNFTTFPKYVDQRFSDLSLHLRERYESQQAAISAALVAAEKLVAAALVSAEKAVDKAESAQQLRNEAQNEFRKSLSDLSGLMWTTKEGIAAVDSLRREFTSSVASVDSKVETLSITRTHATDSLRESMEKRVNSLEASYANLQGRIWAVSALFAIIALAVSVAARFINPLHQ